jgi:hypothetical protein
MIGEVNQGLIAGAILVWKGHALHDCLQIPEGPHFELR